MDDFKADFRGVEFGLESDGSSELVADWLRETCFRRSFLLMVRDGVGFGLDSGCRGEGEFEVSGEEDCFGVEEKLSGTTLGKEDGRISGCCCWGEDVADPRNLRTPFIRAEKLSSSSESALMVSSELNALRNRRLVLLVLPRQQSYCQGSCFII